MYDPVETPAWMRIMVKCIVAIVVSGALVGGCNAVNKRVGLKNDNIIEQAAESIIEQHIGLKIDLSPEESER